ncbi:DEAD/DEAH box helicase [Thetidibacter halocola]|uniref:DEAD/DEAH box helicase n=1 Tax=Thetidibacter halocola TaxID=2827239 RepID=A0A8J7WCA1_9RHOB|nr:DEAD/DEAH box helicase [Thetidibacter halocola]MBS0122518.1 DEAD/DEAH box helicase [Thetidibacter halocola]
MLQCLSDALTQRGYDSLTAVQEAVTRADLQDADLLVSAQTGSGKTVGFGLAIAPTLFDADGTLGVAQAPLALVVAPTRELALQVKRELGWLYAKADARVTTCIGGMDMRDERRALERGAHIVVGTPGRLRDHIQRGSLDMGSLRAIVLDEADEMLDLGFREDLEFMLAEAPQERRTLMFSATVPTAIARLAEKYQRDAVRVTTLGSESQHSDIAYQVLRVAEQDSENAIINLLRYHDAENAIVFANTRAMVNRLTARLTNRGFSVVALSGELSQNERTHALQAMRDGRARVCVATDVAARGIDLPGLELVIHAELPSSAEGLLHRSGRTGRAGRKGISAVIVTPKTARKAERLLSFAKIDADWIAAPSADEILRMDEERLLADPVWSTEPEPEQQDFAARLLALHGPEKIAVAYLALHRAQLCAPEDLADPDTRPERRERKPFGPSRWFALSVGRDDRAEPRWLLPLLCRAGNLDKDAIGAIRVQQSESVVEIAEAAVPGFLAAIGDAGQLEEGVTVRPMEGAPAPAAAPRKAGPRPDRPERAPRPKKDSRTDERPDAAPHPARTVEPKPAAIPEAAAAPETRATPKSDAPRAPVSAAAPASDRPKAPAKKAAPKSDRAKPYSSKPAPASERPRSFAKKVASSDAPKPRQRPRTEDGAPRSAAPGRPSEPRRPESKPRSGAPDKPRNKPFGKPQGNPAEKDRRGGPAGAATRKPDAKPKPPRANAADTSKRFTPPKAAGKQGTPGKPKPQGARPGASPRRKGPGGNEPPRRG